MCGVLIGSNPPSHTYDGGQNFGKKIFCIFQKTQGKKYSFKKFGRDVILYLYL
jgi:hypothetical protein